MGEGTNQDLLHGRYSQDYTGSVPVLVKMRLPVLLERSIVWSQLHHRPESHPDLDSRCANQIIIEDLA